MGARPRGVLSALVLPANFGDEELERLARGQAEAAEALGTAVIGGNLARGNELSVTTTVLGAAKKPLLRAGASVGDVVAVAGAVGLAGAGLQALARSAGPSVAAEAPNAAIERAIAAYRRPRALLEEGWAAASLARAAIDVSDGLALDAARLAKESGVAMVLDADQVVAAGGATLVAAATALSLDALELALHGGDDYALVMVFPPGALPEGFRAIGACQPGSGLFLRAADGGLRALEPRGYDHFPSR
jgi:thiamine-monophosphate kinase